MHNNTWDIYPNTTATHTHTETPGQSQHTMLLFPHAYIHAQSLVMVSSSSLLFSVLPFVACGGEGGWVVTLTQICHIASQHHSNHFNSYTKHLISSISHTNHMCNEFFCNESRTAAHAWASACASVRDVQHQHQWAQVPTEHRHSYKQWSGFTDITTKNSVWLYKYSNVEAKR